MSHGVRRLADLTPTEQQAILNMVCKELLSPQFDPEKYNPPDEADPAREEILGKIPEGAKKLFAYAQQLFIWCLAPPEDTPDDELLVLSLKLEAARQLWIEEIMDRFGEQLSNEKLNGRQFELRHDWTMVVTDRLRDGAGENICGACMLQVRRVEPVGDSDEPFYVPVLATGGLSGAELGRDGN